MRSRVRRKLADIAGSLTLAAARRLFRRRKRRGMTAALPLPVSTSTQATTDPTLRAISAVAPTEPPAASEVAQAMAALEAEVVPVTPSPELQPKGERFKIAPPPADAAEGRAEAEEAERLQTMPFQAVTYHQSHPLTAEDAFSRHLDNVMITAAGKVIKTLRTDSEGSRHQKFVIRISEGQTLLVNHNIDHASRVPVRVGDAVELRGRYIWNEQGGEVHWTHHDPYGVLAGGWIKLARNGKVYE